MCDPITQAVLIGVSKVSEISAQNKAADANRANALTAKNNEQAQQGQSYVEQSRSLIQGGFDEILQGRSDRATAYASAIENGVQGNSVMATIRSLRQKSARGKARTQMEITSLKTQQGLSLSHIGAKAQGRINSVPRTSLGLGDVASILTPIVKAQQD